MGAKPIHAPNDVPIDVPIDVRIDSPIDVPIDVPIDIPWFRPFVVAFAMCELCSLGYSTIRTHAYQNFRLTVSRLTKRSGRVSQ